MKCSNCDESFDVVLPERVGPEGATSGVYQGGEGCVAEFVMEILKLMDMEDGE